MRGGLISCLRLLDQDGNGEFAREDRPARFRRAASRLNTNGGGKIHASELEAADSLLGKRRRDPEPRSPLFFYVDGEQQAPFDLGGANAHMLVFALPDFPTSNGSAPELAALHAKHKASGVRLYFVHADPDLGRERAAVHARDFGIALPVMLDRDQELVRAAGATMSPEVAPLVPDGSIAYRGRIDDLYREVGKKREQATQRGSALALDAVLAGRAVALACTRAVGCDLPPARCEECG